MNRKSRKKQKNRKKKFFLHLESLITYNRISLTEDGVSKTQLNIQQFGHLKEFKALGIIPVTK